MLTGQIDLTIRCIEQVEWERIRDSGILSSKPHYIDPKFLNDWVEGLWINEKLIGIANITSNKNLQYVQEFEKECLDTYCDLEEIAVFESLKSKVLPLYQDGVSLQSLWIKEDYRAQGYGSYFVNHLKNTYPSLFLYALAEAEDFWEQHDFSELLDYFYGYPAPEQLNQ